MCESTINQIWHLYGLGWGITEIVKAVGAPYMDVLMLLDGEL